MKTFKNLSRQTWFSYPSLAVRCALSLLLSLKAVSAGAPGYQQKGFGSPEEATQSLLAVVKAPDAQKLRSIFGPEIADLENPDRVQAANEMQGFAWDLEQSFHLLRDSSVKCVLEVGTNLWPFPIPIIQQGGRWFFDTAAGKEELLNRRIGKNELAALEVVRTYVDAQREYASRDRDGDGVLEYAQKISSSPGQMDGLYWPPELNGEMSPLGPLIAHAQTEGYLFKTASEDAAPRPFHGYLFKILTRQGKHAPGGKYNYVINGNMIGGFGLVAWPAGYGDSGIMTFIVNQQGRVYQKDLGENTEQKIKRLNVYDPDPTWHPSPD